MAAEPFQLSPPVPATQDSPLSETPPGALEESDPAVLENTKRADFLKSLEALEKNYAEQEALLQPWIETHPADADMRFKLAQVQGWQGKFKSSIQNFGILHQAYPTDVDYLTGYAQALVWDQQSKAALPLLQEAKKLKPMYSEIYRIEMQAYEQLNDRPQLESTVQLAKVVFPNEEWKLPPKAVDVRPMQLDMGYSADHISNGLNAWNGQYIGLKKPFSQKAGIYGRAERTNRFSFQDFQFSGGGYFPVSKKFGAVVEGSISPTNYVQPKWSGYAELNRSLPWGFVAHAGFRHAEYRDAIAENGIYTLENYWKRFRTAYTLYNTYLHQSGWANSHVGQIEYTYGKRENTISLTGSLGRQLTNLGEPRGVLATDVQSLYLTGLQWVHPRFGILYTLGVLRQGDIYTQKGVELGLRYLF